MKRKDKAYYRYDIQRSYYYDVHDASGAVVSAMSEFAWKQSVIEYFSTLENCSDIQEVLYIFHDADINEDGTPKGLHVHAVVTFVHNRTISAAIKFFGVSSSYNCQPVDSYVGSVQYLIHVSPSALEACKHIYLPDAVKGFYRDADGIVLPITTKEFYFRMAGKRSRKRKTDRKKVRSECIQSVLSGDSVVSDVLEIYANDVQNVGLSAIDYISDKRLFSDAAQIWLQRIREYYLKHDCPLVSIYITGAGGTGKTTLAEAFARTVMDCHGIHHVAAPNGSTTFDFVGNYQGERISIFNEFSPKYDINGFLNAFDPLKAASVGSRFADKIYFANYALFTTSLDLEIFIYELWKSYAKIYANIPKSERKNLMFECDWYHAYLRGLPESDDKILQIRRRLPIKVELKNRYAYISVLLKQRNSNFSFAFGSIPPAVPVDIPLPYVFYSALEFDVDSPQFPSQLNSVVASLHDAIDFYYRSNSFSVDFSLPDFSGGE